MSEGQFHELKSKGSSLADIFPFPKTLVDSTVCADGRKLVKGISAPPASRRSDGRARVPRWNERSNFQNMILAEVHLIRTYLYVWKMYTYIYDMIMSDVHWPNIYRSPFSGDQTAEQKEIRTWSQDCNFFPNALQSVNPRTSPYTSETKFPCSVVGNFACDRIPS